MTDTLPPCPECASIYTYQVDALLTCPECGHEWQPGATDDAMPEVREKLTAMGLTVGYMTPQQLAAREQAYAQVWARIIKNSGFQPQ